VRSFVRTDGERLPLVVGADGVPAYYPTCYLLSQRSKSLASQTLLANARDIVHIGQWAILEGVDLASRFGSGNYLDHAEVAALAEAAGSQTKWLRQLGSSKITPFQHCAGSFHGRSVSNGTKARRLTTAKRFFELIGRFSEAHVPDIEKRRRAELRKSMSTLLDRHRPHLRSSRVRSALSESQLSLVARFILSGDPSKIWADERVRSRNWAIVNTLLLTGIRQGELRQLKMEDINFTDLTLDIERRPDDPEDPRPVEPNAKTIDRIITIPEKLATVLEGYLFGSGSDAAAVHGSKFVFLTGGNRSTGEPIGEKMVGRIVRDLGTHLGVSDLTPHALRKAWIQNLTRWAINNDISDGQLDRIANYLGGWSDLSTVASRYRGDQLTNLAYEAGLRAEIKRNE